MMLRLANALMHIVHVAIISFSLVGWIAPATRPFHLALAAGIALSWFVLGPAIGHPGFCAVTGVQHALWKKLGHVETPNYMTFLAQRLTGRSPDPERVALVTQWAFYLTTGASLALTLAG